MLWTIVAEHVGRSYRTGVRAAHPPHSAVRNPAGESAVIVVEDNFRKKNCVFLYLTMLKAAAIA